MYIGTTNILLVGTHVNIGFPIEWGPRHTKLPMADMEDT